MTLIDQIVEVVKKSNEPIHYKEIAKQVQIQFNHQPQPFDPYKVYQSIYRNIKKFGDESPFIQTSKSVFGLKGFHKAPALQHKDPQVIPCISSPARGTYPELKFTSSGFKSLDEATSSQDVCNLGLSVRGSGVLKNLNIRTLGDFTAYLFSGSNEKPNNMGKSTHKEILDAAEALADCLNQDKCVDWGLYAEKRGFAVLPQKDIAGFAPLIHELDGMMHDSVSHEYTEEFLTIYKNRWSPKSKTRHSLDEIGQALGLTRERVRQKECIMFAAIRGALLHSDYTNLQVRFRPQVENIFRTLKSHFDNIGKTAWLLSAWADEISSLFKIEKTPLVSNLILLAELQGFETRNSLSKINDEPVVFSKEIPSEEINKTVDVVRGMYDVLCKYPLGVDAIDLVNLMPRKLGGEMLLIDLPAYLDLCPWLEVVGGEIYRLRFTHLVLRADEIVRILSDAGEPLSRHDILRLLNSKSSKKPIKSLTNLVNQMAGDTRIKSIGKSGKWALAEWGVETRSIPEVIIEILTRRGSPMDIEEITEMVQKARTASKVSVAMYLSMRTDAFYSHARGVYGLSIWTKASVKKQPATVYRRKKPLQSDLIVERAVEILHSCPDKAMPLVDLAKLLENEFQVVRNTIYGALAQTSLLEAIPYLDKPGKLCRLIF